MQQNQLSRMGAPSLSSASILEVEPAWGPPISESYFSMIRSFRVEILFHSPLNPAPYSPGPGIADLDSNTVVNLSGLCDHLHWLVARFRLRPQPVVRLEIDVRFSNTLTAPSGVLMPAHLFPAVHALLNPFRRLYNVNKPQVASITINDPLGREINLLVPGRMDSRARRDYDRYLGLWSLDLSGPRASFKYANGLQFYWRVANLICVIRDHCSTEPTPWKMAELLVAAKVARENGDLDALRTVWDRVSTLWFKYLDEQEVYQSRITQSILKSSEAARNETSRLEVGIEPEPK